VHNTPAIERLVASLKRLPGVGEKSATRLTYFLLNASDELVSEFSEALVRLKQDTSICESCFTLCEKSPCKVCGDPRRDPTVLCVVAEPADLGSIEKSGEFSGLYLVLGGTLSPIDGMGPEDLRITELDQRVRGGGVQEVILATNPNAEGDATAHYLAQRLKETGVRITRIACGMPLGGNLQYADHVTVGRSLANRTAFS
jgi:recombination protein RecR